MQLWELCCAEIWYRWLSRQTSSSAERESTALSSAATAAECVCLQMQHLSAGICLLLLLLSQVRFRSFLPYQSVWLALYGSGAIAISFPLPPTTSSSSFFSLLLSLSLAVTLCISPPLSSHIFKLSNSSNQDETFTPTVDIHYEPTQPDPTFIWNDDERETGYASSSPGGPARWSAGFSFTYIYIFLHWFCFDTRYGGPWQFAHSMPSNFHRSSSLFLSAIASKSSSSA